MLKQILIGVLMLALGAAGAAAWLRTKQPSTIASGAPASGTVAPAAATGKASKGPASPVAPMVMELSAQELFTVASGELARQVPITGTLRASNQTVVKSKVAGELTAILVREGSLVKAGELVARIDTVDFDLRLKEREAQFRGAEAQLEQARRTLENNRQLLEKNFISQSAFDNARSGHDVAVANLDASKAQLAQARKSLADTRITSPMAGTVAERFAQPGEKVSPDNRILSIVDLGRMELEAAVASSDIGSVRIGQELSLTIEGMSQALRGKVARISPSTQTGTRSVPIFIALENRDSRLRAGLFAQGSLTLDKRANVLTVPINALRESAGRNFVYLVEGDKLSEREVKLGARDETGRASNGSEGVVEVLSGLKAGERIVGVNLGTLRPGILVKMK